MRTCVILQPSYIPWRGFFDLVHQADVFVFYDDVQYDKHGWRNRNRVKTAQGTQWLTIPVVASGNVETGLPLREARIAQPGFGKKHLSTIKQSYSKAPHFREYFPRVEALLGTPKELLLDVTIPSTVELAHLLGIEHTRFLRSSELGVLGGKTERLVEIARHVGCDRYLSGPSARSYIDPDVFARAGVHLDYAVYEYPEYPQLHPPFDPQVTVLDLLFMTGANAGDFIWGAKKDRAR